MPRRTFSRDFPARKCSWVANTVPPLPYNPDVTIQGTSCTFDDHLYVCSRTRSRRDCALRRVIAALKREREKEREKERERDRGARIFVRTGRLRADRALCAGINIRETGGVPIYNGDIIDDYLRFRVDNRKFCRQKGAGRFETLPSNSFSLSLFLSVVSLRYQWSFSSSKLSLSVHGPPLSRALRTAGRV